MLRLAVIFGLALTLPAAAAPSARDLKDQIATVMARTHAQGLAIAIIQDGRIRSVAADL